MVKLVMIVWTMNMVATPTDLPTVVPSMHACQHLAHELNTNPDKLDYIQFSCRVSVN